MAYQCDLKLCRENNSPGNAMIHKTPRTVSVLHEWEKAIIAAQPDFKFSKISKICSLHFVESDYIISSVSKTKVLKTTAVPSVFTKSTHKMLLSPSTSEIMPSTSLILPSTSQILISTSEIIPSTSQTLPPTTQCGSLSPTLSENCRLSPTSFDDQFPDVIHGLDSSELSEEPTSFDFHPVWDANAIPKLRTKYGVSCFDHDDLPTYDNPHDCSRVSPTFYQAFKNKLEIKERGTVNPYLPWFVGVVPKTRFDIGMDRHYHKFLKIVMTETISYTIQKFRSPGI